MQGTQRLCSAQPKLVFQGWVPRMGLWKPELFPSITAVQRSKQQELALAAETLPVCAVQVFLKKVNKLLANRGGIERRELPQLSSNMKRN